MKYFSGNESDWAFWSRWYLAILAGTWSDWELCRDIALIPDDIWEEGPAAVADAIRKIEHQRKALPPEAARTQAQHLLRDPKRSSLYAAGLAQLLGTAIHAVGNALPDPFAAAEPLQKYLQQISAVLLATHLTDQEAQLAKLLEQAADTVARLVRELREAQAEIGLLEAKLAAAETAAEKAELQAQAAENPKINWRQKVSDSALTGFGENTGALFSGVLWGGLGVGLMYLLGPDANDAVAATSQCFNDIIQPVYLREVTQAVSLDI